MWMHCSTRPPSAMSNSNHPTAAWCSSERRTVDGAKRLGSGGSIDALVRSLPRLVRPLPALPVPDTRTSHPTSRRLTASSAPVDRTARRVDHSILATDVVRDHLVSCGSKRSRAGNSCRPLDRFCPLVVHFNKAQAQTHDLAWAFILNGREGGMITKSPELLEHQFGCGTSTRSRHGSPQRVLLNASTRLLAVRSPRWAEVSRRFISLRCLSDFAS
jgi:hypothetical protein